MYIYLYLNIFTILFPLLLSFDRRVAFYKSWPALFPAILLNAVVFIAWDAFFTDLGVWGFNEAYLTGIYLWNLPLEEILFFITVPYACVFIYDVLRAYVQRDLLKPYTKGIAFFLVLALPLVAIFNIAKLYTSITFIALAILHMVHLRYFGAKYLGRFYLAYLVHLVPFLLVNGVLTYLPIVWYNNDYNLGLRLVSIPVEDTMYSMLMLLLTISVYEGLRQRKAVKQYEPLAV
ncbi:lycopene cyclase domain-containing protein [Pontibacter ummariensis]|uniref:Lycopene cyclase domain-containing protein n=1 Tax=Pontibacter ummariensis TaxID=1610492 RepID=A0A239EWB5_9BACT|nr:lycopene cyclase domain-containing protein [Pontibacter ummariensis]PRY12717.1 lycopene cyclase domain-containing protein [Pontibacter ummariensis]SNS48877.1 lycopene cyclase domain-containing protein [Pontibacter ummariensis]